MVSAENACLPKISGSGRKLIEVPVPRAAPTLRSLLTALPRSYFCSQSAPSRRTSAVSCSDSALTTDEPTPWRPPEN